MSSWIDLQIRATRVRVSVAPSILPLLVAIGGAAEIPINVADGTPDPAVIAINARDTVTWTLTSARSTGVEAIGGAWQSPLLVNVGASFSYTFTNAGFVAYRTVSQFGTIDVMPWTNNPPAISIYDPVDGFYLPTYPFQYSTTFIPIQASVNNTSRVQRVDFFVDAKWVGTATNAPYRVAWKLSWWDPQPGAHVLTAILVDGDGASVSCRPIGVVLGSTVLFGERRLPGGEFLCYWCTDSLVVPISLRLVSVDALASHTYTVLSGPASQGVFVDTAATNATRRFYFLATP